MSDSVPIETAHEDMIVSRSLCCLVLSLTYFHQHDAQLDYYGKRLATCSSDRTVKVFDVVDGDAQRSTNGQTLKGCVILEGWIEDWQLNSNSQSYRTSLAGRLGTPKVWPHLGFMLIRWESVHLEGTAGTRIEFRRMDENQGALTSYRFRCVCIKKL